MADTNTQRAPKCQRTSRSTVHYDTIPIDEEDDYQQVFHREGRLRRIRNDVLTATTSRTVAAVDQRHWTTLSTWAPLDDVNYALETDGSGYENAVDADVMVEEPVVQKKHSRSCVSVSLVSGTTRLLILTVFHVEAASRCMEGAPPLKLSRQAHKMGRKGRFSQLHSMFRLCIAQGTNTRQSRV